MYFQVHPWVNYESLLKSCVIGRLMSISNSPTSSSVWNDSLEKPVNDRVMSLNSKLSAARITRVPSISEWSILFSLENHCILLEEVGGNVIVTYIYILS